MVFYKRPENSLYPPTHETRVVDGITPNDYELKVTYVDPDDGDEFYTIYGEVQGLELEVELFDPGKPTHEEVLNELETAFENYGPDDDSWTTPGGYRM